MRMAGGRRGRRFLMRTSSVEFSMPALVLNLPRDSDIARDGWPVAPRVRRDRRAPGSTPASFTSSAAFVMLTGAQRGAIASHSSDGASRCTAHTASAAPISPYAPAPLADLAPRYRSLDGSPACPLAPRSAPESLKCVQCCVGFARAAGGRDPAPSSPRDCFEVRANHPETHVSCGRAGSVRGSYFDVACARSDKGERRWVAAAARRLNRAGWDGCTQSPCESDSRCGGWR